MSDENKSSGDTASFIGFCGLVLVIVCFFLPSVLLLMPFHEFSLSESFTIALREPLCFIGSLLFWFFLLILWAKKKG